MRKFNRIVLETSPTESECGVTPLNFSRHADWASQWAREHVLLARFKNQKWIELPILIIKYAMGSIKKEEKTAELEFWGLQVGHPGSNYSVLAKELKKYWGPNGYLAYIEEEKGDGTLSHRDLQYEEFVSILDKFFFYFVEDQVRKRREYIETILHQRSL